MPPLYERVVCRNEECADSRERSPDPPQLTRIGERENAWVFKCARCEREGRVALRVVTKNLIGGTVGAGRTDDNRGKGLRRYTPGVRFA